MSVISGGFGDGRPPPPDDLNGRQGTIWRETVASEPPDFFDSAALRALLSDYCRHREAAEIISAQVNSFVPSSLQTEDGAKLYALLLRTRVGETRAAVTIATKLRLTNQSRYSKAVAATAVKHSSKGGRPWEA